MHAPCLPQPATPSATATATAAAPQVLRELHRSCQTEEGLDDLKKGTQLLEIYALEIQMHTEAKNSKKLKELYQVGGERGRVGGCGEAGLVGTGWVGVWEEGAWGFEHNSPATVLCSAPAACCAFSIAHPPSCNQPPLPHTLSGPLRASCPLPPRRKLWPSSLPSPTLASWE
jgi:hypothetical protein